MNNQHSRKAQIATLLDKLNTGKCITERAIQSALTVEEYQELLAKIDQMICARMEKPRITRRVLSAFRCYIKLLKIGALLDARAEATPSHLIAAPKSLFIRPRHLAGLTSRKLLSTKAENAYADALEELEGLLLRNPSLQAFLDRHACFDQNGGTVSPDAGGVPRLINSTSEYATHYTGDRKTKRELQRVALQSSLIRLEFVSDLKSPAPSAPDNSFGPVRISTGGECCLEPIGPYLQNCIIACMHNCNGRCQYHGTDLDNGLL